MVYVDDDNFKNGDWIQCNMVADTDDELFAIAEVCGLRKDWVKTGMYRNRMHFEIAQSKKKLAIKAGALEVSMVELLTMFAVNVPHEELSIADVPYMHKADIKGPNDITIKVGEVSYCIPNYCLAPYLWGMPDSFYPCDKYHWLDNVVELTTVEMVEEAFAANPDKFKSFILYPHNKTQ